MIYVVIPVFNRLEKTKSIISCLREQTSKDFIHTIIIDDGSTDGTSEWLKKQNDIKTIKGTGNLLWGGAVNLAFNYLERIATFKDWVVLINNDVIVEKDYINNIFNLAKKYYPAAIGSAIKNCSETPEINSLKIKIDTWNLKIYDELKNTKKYKNVGITESDVLSGRGVIYPLEKIIKCGGMRPKILPHYYADYELSLRAKKMGLKLLVSLDNCVFSTEDFIKKNAERKKEKFLKKLLLRKSSSYFIAKIAFWIQASNWLELITLPFRIIIFMILPKPGSKLF